jgi:hypothetical protein
MKLIPALAPSARSFCPARSPPKLRRQGDHEDHLPDSRTAPVDDMSIKEGFMRMDITRQGAPMAMITDLKNQQMIMLMAQQRMYMVRPLPQPGAGGAGGHAPGPAAQQARPRNPAGHRRRRRPSSATSARSGRHGREGTPRSGSRTSSGRSSASSTAAARAAGPRRPRPGSRPQGQGNFFPMRVVTTTNGKENLPARGDLGREDEPPGLPLRPPEGYRSSTSAR